jgi:DNA-binding NarL/FixJ family response regulator
MRAAAIRVAIIEDDNVVRQGLAKLIASANGFLCVSAVGSAEEAMVQLPVAAPDVVLVDLGLPGISGIDCIRFLKPVLPGSQFMVLTGLEDDNLVFQAIEAGATGYLLKSVPQNGMIETWIERFWP